MMWLFLVVLVGCITIVLCVAISEAGTLGDVLSQVRLSYVDGRLDRIERQLKELDKILREKEAGGKHG